MALSMRKKREAGERTPSEYVAQRKNELRDARQRAADADAALKRAQVAHQQVTEAAERDEAAHVAVLEQARDGLAAALADGGDVDGARAKLNELEQAAERRRSEAGVLSNILQRRRSEKGEAGKAVRSAEKAYWFAIERLELDRIPDLDALRRAFVAHMKGSPIGVAGFGEYLSDLLGPMAQSQIAAVYDSLDKDYGR